MSGAGEFELIAEFTRALGVPPSPQGPGDDCAVLKPRPGQLCVTTDATVEGVHFTRPAFSLRDVGHKALAVNLSDLAAMGARPAWVLVALGLPRAFKRREVRALAAGMGELLRASGAQVVGGNITRSPVLSLTLTVGGHASRPMLRSGARPGDGLYVVGTLGAAAGGLLPQAPASLVRAQRRPRPCLAEGLRAAHFASAAIDVSDGLLQDLGHLLAASKVGAEVDSARLPMLPALRRFAAGRALTLALTGGEDYALLLAVPPRHARAFERAVRARHIGTVTRGRALRVDGRLWRGAAGFDHLRTT